MAAAVMTLGMGTQRIGPALRRFRVPLGPLALSTIAHVALIVGVVAGAAIWRTTPTKTYVVNLVPAVAAVGVPRQEPVLPPRPTDPALPKELPAARELPPMREMPARDLPSRSAALPDRTPPPTPALPRPGDKELPSVASAPKPAPVLPPPTTPARVEPPSSPPIGSPSGSPQGAGAVTLNVADFPYAWYIQAVHRKIQERWEGRAIEGRQPEIIFEIERNGRLRRVAVGKTSGNSAYDQLAVRAISEANPFPALPDGFEKPTLTVGLQFVYDPRAR
jgi:periplasmic protein TonB